MALCAICNTTCTSTLFFCNLAAANSSYVSMQKHAKRCAYFDEGFSTPKTYLCNLAHRYNDCPEKGAFPAYQCGTFNKNANEPKCVDCWRRSLAEKMKAFSVSNRVPRSVARQILAHCLVGWPRSHGVAPRTGAVFNLVSEPLGVRVNLLAVLRGGMRGVMRSVYARS